MPGALGEALSLFEPTECLSQSKSQAIVSKMESNFANPPTPPPSSTQAIPLSSSEESPSPIPPRLLSESLTSPNSSPATSPKIPPSADSAKKTPASLRRQFQQRVPQSPDGPSSAQPNGLGLREGASCSLKANLISPFVSLCPSDNSRCYPTTWGATPFCPMLVSPRPLAKLGKRSK